MSKSNGDNEEGRPRQKRSIINEEEDHFEENVSLLKLIPNKKRRADWQIEDVFVEYFGLAGNAAYDQRTSEKLQLAAECDLELIALFPEDVVDLDNALLKNLL